MENTEILLEYDKTETNEIHYEEINRFEESLFRNVYASAFSQVENILNCNENRMDFNNGNERRKNRQIDNLVCFLGERGTGKTSAMLSFMEALKDYYYSSKGSSMFYPFKVGGKKTNVNFLCLDHIDASLLENGEDLFEVILTMMYHKLADLENDHFLRKDNFEYQKRELLRRFEKTFAGIRNLKRKNYADEEFEAYGSYMSTMKSMAVSMTLKNEFEALVKAYLELIQFKKEASIPSDWNNCKDSYLVITIDDMDLNLESGYAMLEQIHRYLMIRQVIVLLAVDDIQMREICERHFWGLYCNNPNTQRVTEWQERIQYTAKQYMDKVLPIYRRIYMPRLQDMKGIIKIRQKGGKTAENIKQFLLHKIAEKVLVCFDMCGNKQHFYEPKNIRGIISLCQALDYLEDLKVEDEQLLEKFEKNYAWLASDIYRRMVGEQLIGEDYRAFQWIREYVPATRGDAAWRKLKQLIRESKVIHNDYLEKKTDYAYGELLRALYIYGRIEQKNKSLVRCLLASFSVIYTKQYMLSIYGKTEEQKDNALRNLKLLMGNSVSGSWTNEMLPGILIRKEGIIDNRFFKIGDINKAKVNNLVIGSLKDDWIEKENIRSKIEKNEQLQMDWVAEIELLLMFFGNYQDDLGNRVECRIMIPKENKDNTESYGKMKEDPALILPDGDINLTLLERADFNLFGFVSALYKWHDYFVCIDRAIFQALKEYYDVKNIEMQEYLQKKIAESSLENKYLEWHEKYHGFVLPFYNLDLTYNVLKHAMYEFKSTQEQFVTEDKIVEQIWNMYSRVSAELIKEDGYYETVRNENFGIANWNAAFMESPFIAEFSKHHTQQNDPFNERFLKLLNLICNLNPNLSQSSGSDAISMADMTVMV